MYKIVFYLFLFDSCSIVGWKKEYWFQIDNYRGYCNSYVFGRLVTSSHFLIIFLHYVTVSDSSHHHHYFFEYLIIGKVNKVIQTSTNRKCCSYVKFSLDLLIIRSCPFFHWLLFFTASLGPGHL